MSIVAYPLAGERLGKVRDMRNVRQGVETILKEYEGKYGKTRILNQDPRNNDSYLIILFLRKYMPGVLRSKCPKCGSVNTVWFDRNVIENISGLFEDIRRARQKFNHDGFYLPTDPLVLAKRGRKEIDTRSEMGATQSGF